MSTKIVRPEVFDPELRSTLACVGSNIENYTANLDAVSRDIKAIENYLASSGIRLDVNVPFSTVHFTISGGIEEVVESLLWAAEDIPFDDDSDVRWRLLYQRSTQQGSFDGFMGEFVGARGIQITDRKPLIETIVVVRLRAHRHLAALVSEIAKLVEVSPIADETNELPF